MYQYQYQYKRRTYKRQTLQKSDSTHVGLTIVGWYKRRTETIVGPVQTSDGNIYEEKRRTIVELEKNTIAIRNKLKITRLLC